MMANNEGTAMAEGVLFNGEVTEHVPNAFFAVRALRRTFSFTSETLTSSDLPIIPGSNAWTGKIK